MARLRGVKTRDLPLNLYVRKDGYYSYRDPRSGKEFGLGRDKRAAVTQAIEANLALAQTLSPVKLVERIQEAKTITVAEWFVIYFVELERRRVKPTTLREYKRMSKLFETKLGDAPINLIDTRIIVAFLAEWRDAGKSTSYNRIRAFLKDSFSSAIAEGYIVANPLEHIKNERVTISRSRLSFDQFITICEKADSINFWARPAFELALLTGQRISDIHGITWDSIKDNKIYITQSKTGMKLAIDINTSLHALGKTVSDVLDELKVLRKNKAQVVPVSSVNYLTRIFAKSRDETTLEWEGDKPSFHEIRSLAARMYKEERGAEFAQRLLGHKSAQMTEKYIDNRGSEYIAI